MVVKTPVIYPSSDGRPMAENTLQFQWIVTIKGGLEVVFENDPNVFVAGDLLWYPVEGEPRTCAAPDAMVVFGRPKGHRLSYMQWAEGGIGPQVTFEVLSPGNTPIEMTNKLRFYETHGVEEYYVYDPERPSIQGWIREGGRLQPLAGIEHGWTSPRLNVKFALESELVLIGPDGRHFLTYEQLAKERYQEQLRADKQQKRADLERKLAEKERKRAEMEKKRAETEKRRAEKERQRAEKEKNRAEKEHLAAEEFKRQLEESKTQNEALRERLKALGIDVDRE